MASTSVRVRKLICPAVCFAVTGLFYYLLILSVMRNTEAKAKSTKQDKAASVAAAKSIVEGYHEGATLEDKLMRKDIIIHLLVCIVTSDWWLANNDTMRTDMIHHIVRVDDTMDALDVMYN